MDEVIIEFLWLGDVVTAEVVIHNGHAYAVSLVDDQGDELGEVSESMLDLVETSAMSMWMDAQSEFTLSSTEH